MSEEDVPTKLRTVVRELREKADLFELAADRIETLETAMSDVTDSQSV